jgi:hypothetical protein
MNFMAERSNLLKSYCQKDAHLDQVGRGPDSHRGRRSSNPPRWCIFCASFFAASRGNQLNFQHRFWFREPKFGAAASLLSLGAYNTYLYPSYRFGPLVEDAGALDERKSRDSDVVACYAARNIVLQKRAWREQSVKALHESRPSYRRKPIFDSQIIFNDRLLDTNLKIS